VKVELLRRPRIVVDELIVIDDHYSFPLEELWACVEALTEHPCSLNPDIQVPLFELGLVDAKDGVCSPTAPFEEFAGQVRNLWEQFTDEALGQ
jgi:hypothetical protein